MMKRICIILLLLACVLNAYAIKVVFRLDDPTVRYDSVHSRIMQLFMDKEVPLSVGVIPCDSNGVAYEPNDSAYLALLHSPLIEVCLHGLTHQKIDNKGEFGVLSGEESKRRIAKGKTILSQRIGKDIVTFIPPWNVINDSIPYILAEEGFKVISGELFVESLERKPKGVDIMYIPETLGHLMAHHGVLKAARETIFRHSSDNAVCVVMIHAYDFPDENAWTELNDMLEDCKADCKIELYTFSSLYESGEKMDRERYKANLLSSGLAKIILRDGVMYPTWVCYAVHILNALLYVLMATIGFLYWVSILKRKERRLFLWLGVLVGTLFFCISWWHWMSPIKLLMFAAVLGVFPLMLAVVYRKCSK